MTPYSSYGNNLKTGCPAEGEKKKKHYKPSEYPAAAIPVLTGSPLISTSWDHLHTPEMPS